MRYHRYNVCTASSLVDPSLTQTIHQTASSVISLFLTQFLPMTAPIGPPNPPFKTIHILSHSLIEFPYVTFIQCTQHHYYVEHANLPLFRYFSLLPCILEIPYGLLNITQSDIEFCFHSFILTKIYS